MYLLFSRHLLARKVYNKSENNFLSYKKAYKCKIYAYMDFLQWNFVGTTWTRTEIILI